MKCVLVFFEFAIGRIYIMCVGKGGGRGGGVSWHVLVNKLV